MASKQYLAPLRALLQQPASIRTLLPLSNTSTIHQTSTLNTTTPHTSRPHQRTNPRPSQRRTYYSYETPPAPLYPAAETTILTSALTHVPSLGFSQNALRAGAQDVGFREASANLFPAGEFEIVLFHLRMQRTGLGERISFGDESRLGVGKKVRALVMERLRGNEQARILGRWQEVSAPFFSSRHKMSTTARGIGVNDGISTNDRPTQALALMSLAGNIPPSLRELFLLSDEIWFLAGDTSVDTSWYTKRATLASIYGAAEIFQTTDQSTGFKDTEEFLDRRLEEARTLGGAWNNVKEWGAFQAIAGVNLARSLGARI